MFKSIFIILVLLLYCSAGICQVNTYSLSEEKNLYKKIADVELNTVQGKINLSSIYDKSPVLLALVFSRCSGVCNPMLMNLSKTIRNIKSDRNFHILVVSFDLRDSLSDLIAMANHYVPIGEKPWFFATTRQIKELNSSIGFTPVWDSVRMQFDHEPMIVGVNENGFISRKLIGIRNSDELLTVIKDVNNEFIPSYPLPRKGMVFSCFTYDPVTGVKKPSLGLLVLLIPAVLTGFILLFLSFRKQHKMIDSNG